METDTADTATGRSLANKLKKLVCSAALVVVLSFAAAPAVADDHDSKRSGHPLRIAAYVVHPIGVILDTLIFRPAHWVVSKEPLKTLFGHTD